jgi:hypothetical protein
MRGCAIDVMSLPFAKPAVPIPRKWGHQPVSRSLITIS